MPGTHSKWVRVKDGTVAQFSTFMTGELFSVVSRETILSLAVAGADEAEDIASFKSAVKAAFEAPAFASQSPVHRAVASTAVRRHAGCGARDVSGTLIGAELAAGLSGRRAKGWNHADRIGSAGGSVPAGVRRPVGQCEPDRCR